MKRILVPTDFSKHAGYALHVAAQLAKRLDAELYLVHMLELPLPQVDALSAHKDLPEVLFFMKAAHKRFKAIAQQDELKGIKVHEIIKPSKAFNGIMAECSAHDVDLIVMGSHGSSGFQEMFS